MEKPWFFDSPNAGKFHSPNAGKYDQNNTEYGHFLRSGSKHVFAKHIKCNFKYSI